uniref:DNA polymerase delta subunit 3 n=1 Tax=Bactrocera latifrons TaxID=174628 RepID=A0A0K8VXN4_BACLA
MCAAKLEEALNDCVINFDKRVLLTDLINEYHMPIDEISSTLTKYLKQQEKEGTKFEKRYVIHGLEKEDANKEIFTIVKGEEKLKEWLSKLEDVESALYSVEIAGGAKAPAEDLKPVTWCAIKIEDLQKRTGDAKAINGLAESIKNECVKVESKTDVKPAKGIASAFAKTKQSNTSDSSSVTDAKNKDAVTSKTKAAAKDKPSPQDKAKSELDDVKKSPQKTIEQKKISPKDKKAAAAGSGQKGIGNFFAPKGKQPAETTGKAATGVIRQKSPKKLNDFFKKQTDNKETVKKEADKANTSAQLFDDEDDGEQKEESKMEEDEEAPVEVHVESSDEEEEINKLRRKVIETEKAEAATSRKRLRIEDSDDEDDVAGEEEQPQPKQGKIDTAEVTEIADTPPKSETYLDEDGFVITIKSKTHARQKTPKKTSPKKSPKESKSKPTPAAKTKQGNIMNFFKKK